MSFSTIPEILEDLRNGRVIVLVDDENRENEGDFVVAAEHVTPELVNFLTRVGGVRGRDGPTCDRLELGPQGDQHQPSPDPVRSRSTDTRGMAWVPASVPVIGQSPFG